MKKIINSKLYNTDTAKEIGYYTWGSGFDKVEETLYLKRTGEFFLHGAGGARSKYGGYDGNSWYWGQDIIPLSADDAREWAEKHCDPDVYQKYFEISDDDPDAAYVIKSLRKSTGLTQLEFCDRYGIPRRTLQDWENGLRVPPAYVVELLKYRIEH